MIDTDRTASRRWPRIDPVVATMAALVVIPMITLIVQLHGVEWYPTGDLAQAEMRMIRFLDHPPLVGAAGRIMNEQGVQGNHPGPLMFWAIWPVWWVLGGTSWAFAASTAWLNLVGAVTSVWLAARRLGRRGAALWALALAGLIGGFGLDALTQAWNPWVALMPFAVFVLAVWGYVDGEPMMLPLAVGVGSWALQAHVGYVVPVPLLLGTAIAYVAMCRRLNWRSIAAAAAVGAAAWALPIYQQLTQTPGNLSIIYANFANPDADPIGFGSALRVALQLLNPVGAWVRAAPAPSGSVIPGLVVTVAWIVSAVWSVRRWRTARSTSGDLEIPSPFDESFRGLHSLVRLHGVVFIAWCTGLLAISRVFGEVYIYTFRWVVIVTAFILMSIVATAIDMVLAGVVGNRVARKFAAHRTMVTGIAVATLAVVSISTAVQVSAQEIPYTAGWKTEAKLAPRVLAQLDRSKLYHVSWDDPVSLGGLGFGLMLAADRAGFRVQTDQVFAAGVEWERIGKRETADAELHVVTGQSLEKWRAAGVGTELASADIRTPAQRREFDRLQERLFDEVDRKGLEWNRETPMFVMMSDPALSAQAHTWLDRLITIGQPTAVFLTEPGAAIR